MLKNIIFDFTGVIFINQQINNELIDWIKLNKKNYNFYVLTNNTKEVKKFLDKNVFDEVFTYSDTGFLKPDKRSFEYILKEMECLGESCLFIDDRKENILAAKELNFSIVLFEGNDQFFKEVKI